MNFTPSELAKILNIKLDYLFKIFSKCGLKKMDSYSSKQLKFIVDSLDSNHYKTKLLKKKLLKVVEDVK